MILPIYNAYHPVLREKSIPVKDINGEVNSFVNNMWDTLYNIGNGVGLAANQVGEKHSITVIDINRGGDDFPDSKPIAMINPIIEFYSEEEEDMQEGCLSIPEFFEQVTRPAEIQVKYYDTEMKERRENYGGFLARVMQHEIDHLNGILFFDRLSTLRRALSKSKLKRIEKGEVEAEYQMINADGSKYEPGAISK